MKITKRITKTIIIKSILFKSLSIFLFMLCSTLLKLSTLFVTLVVILCFISKSSFFEKPSNSGITSISFSFSILN